MCHLSPDARGAHLGRMSARVEHAEREGKTDVAHCVTCGSPLHGRFCHQCGERALTSGDHRLITFLREAAAGALDVDSRLWRSFRALLLEPGRLTAEYLRGRRQPYLPPLQVFLLANLLFFGVLTTVGGFNTFTTMLRYQRDMPYGSVVRELVDRHGAPGTAEAMVYERRFNEATPRYANSLVILIVPMFALVFKLLDRRHYYVHHLIFALHFVAYLLLVVTLMPFVITGIMRLAPASAAAFGGELAIGLLASALFAIYLGAAWRRAWDYPPVASYVRGLVGIAMLMPVLMIYRMILFFVVYFRT